MGFGNMSEKKDIELIIGHVKTYTQMLGLINNFQIHLDTSGLYFNSNEDRGKIDFNNSKILVNLNGLTDRTDLLPEYTASVVAYLQPHCFLYEEAKNKRLKRPAEHVLEVINRSVVFWGVCKKLEFDVGHTLESNYGFKFSEVWPDTMRMVMSDEEIDNLDEEELKSFNMTKVQLKKFNRGYRWYEQLQKKSSGHRRENDILRASLKIAIESENFDDTYQQLLNYSTDDIFIQAGLMIKREVNTLDLALVEEKIKNIRALMGGQAQGKEVKKELDNLGHILENAGVRRSILEKYNELQKEGKRMPELEPLREKDITLVNLILQLVETEYVERVKSEKTETWDIG
jgi:hypothetical protein